MNVGCRAVCMRCMCVCTCQEAMFHLPANEEKKCVDTLPLHVDVVLDSPQRDGGVLSAKGGGMLKKCARSDSLEDHMSLAVEARYDFRTDASSCIDCAPNNTQGSLSVDLKA